MNGLKVLFMLAFTMVLSLTAFAQTENALPLGLRTVNDRVEVYPNPNNDVLHVKLDNINVNSLEMEVFNIIGNNIKIDAEEVIKNRYYRIDTHDFQPGYYLLVLKDPKTRFNKAIRIKKE
ncbi:MULTISPECIES: T9SS type A sorting domain-containing protein [Persicobacter]|uniref:Secretion system C-terminal sorting domain-containing protein n=1 Tax=Persicobacter diffluens TaxID=981 RepID=A0AAN5AKD8_9BACT|nr:T9SS type A sorting domain-containing protein [Persicobacter sp. CCB-QB2]GJM59788.1 hypothetical protein PEDI_03400 [Persicobacter diffluens]